MGKKKNITRTEELYEEKYGHIPLEKEAILEYLRNTIKIDMAKVESEKDKIDALGWKELEIILPLVPSPSPRPRYNFATEHFYVRGAQENKKIIQRYITDANIIYTRTKLKIETYQPIPMSTMKKHEIYLAELGYIIPIQDPDYDNLAKTYTDMIQGILLLNDNIVSNGAVDKYFSIKPRVVIRIQFQDGFDSDFNYKKITKSTAYLKSDIAPVEKGETIYGNSD